MFGSGMPFSYPDPALLKLELLKASRDEKQMIQWQNAEQWLAH
jgi:uncharacterized protein